MIKVTLQPAGTWAELTPASPLSNLEKAILERLTNPNTTTTHIIVKHSDSDTELHYTKESD